MSYPDTNTQITLQFPVRGTNGENVTELQFRRPKVRDQILFEKAKGTDAEREITLFARLCGVDEDLIASLDLIDYGQLGNAYKACVSPSRSEPSSA